MSGTTKKPGDELLACLDCGTTEGVEIRTTPDRTDGRGFPRCESCFEKRLEESKRILELTSATPPSWFDPAYAGERWDEDY